MTAALAVYAAFLTAWLVTVVRRVHTLEAQTLAPAPPWDEPDCYEDADDGIAVCPRCDGEYVYDGAVFCPDCEAEGDL